MPSPTALTAFDFLHTSSINADSRSQWGDTLYRLLKDLLGASRLGAGWVFEKQLQPLATSEISSILLTFGLADQPCP